MISVKQISFLLWGKNARIMYTNNKHIIYRKTYGGKVYEIGYT